jgi:hypothetical protein
MPKAKRKRPTPLSKLFGAARKNRMKTLRRNKARKLSRMRRNAVKSSRSGGMVLSEAEYKKRAAAARKRRAAAKKKKTYKTKTRGRAASPAKRKTTKKRTTKKRTTTKRKTTKRKSTKKRTTTKRKTTKRRTAAKTTRRKPARKKGRKVAKRKGKMTKKARRAAALKGWRRKKAAKRMYRRAVKQTKRATRRKLKRPLRKSRVKRSLRKGRVSILRAKAYGSAADRRFMRKHKMRSNPMGGAMDAVKKAIPVGVAMYAGRIICRGVLPRVPVLNSLGQHAAPVGAAGLVVAASYLTRKGKLAKYRQEALMGLGLNFLDIALTTYAPASVKAYIGLGQEDIYDSAFGEYVDVGEYLDVGAYEEMGEYVQMGAEEELGLEEELGMGGAADDLQIGTGIGTPRSSMVRQIPGRAMSAPVPSRSFTKEVPGVGAGYDKMANLYTGIFGGGFGN